MKFIAEILEVKSRKTASLDIEYTLKLRSDNHDIITLAAIPADELVVVEITPEKHDSA